MDDDFLYRDAETNERFNIFLQGLCDKIQINFYMMIFT